MVILPAIDLLDGKVVRLTQGQRDQVTVYSDDPVAVAKRWSAAGATWLHVVDLNGAFEGQYRNLETAERIIQETGVNVELSGGIRSKETLARCFTAGAKRVVLGTKACEDPAFIQEATDRHGPKIAVAIDAKAGRVVSRGWTSSTDLTPEQLARSVQLLGVALFICTDVTRDGTLQGPNLEALRQILSLGHLQIIASGGISSTQDLMRLRELEGQGLVGAIVGKALYEGAIDLKHAIEVAKWRSGEVNSLWPPSHLAT
ncbi:MAG: 1-(5-phosphoribosyl)-5-[(5-phosphoribosylamino)methylideneamino]imidazole-4-carboxamide isomerase [Candidatus Omnitrophica bacterium]|nr:1-(5-phosphoribosyl)-5-[(5-phosphoribosylamino)methylideneamino]imidazole-4-carboxamide isomerase [Candidatus Omnitrophota bacterium]